ncbi:MAG: DUF2189 domain-containing protein [Shinella sp.]|nr:DUF2189 domain-containing protein [Shinella sp.]
MTTFHVMAGAGEAAELPVIRKITTADVWQALRLGFEDFRAKPSHYVFLTLIYPLSGIVLITWSSGANMLPLIFPLLGGFALLGPFFALGLYEVSRRRELGMDASWRHALDVRHSPALPSILVAGFMLLVMFVAWMGTAQGLYTSLFGEEPPPALGPFLASIFSTDAGWMLIVIGNVIGFCFAVGVLATSVVTFPLLLDRDVGAVSAIKTSIRATIVNPVPVALWGLIVAAGLAIGMLPVLAGLAVTMPILGHATWHLYRKLVVDGNA